MVPRPGIDTAFRSARKAFLRTTFARIFFFTSVIALIASVGLLTAVAQIQANLKTEELPISFAVVTAVLCTALLLCALYSAIVSVLLQPTGPQFARSVDRRLGLRDALATAIALGGQANPPPMLQLLERTLLTQTRGLDVRPILPRTPLLLVVATMILALGTLVLPLAASRTKMPTPGPQMPPVGHALGSPSEPEAWTPFVWNPADWVLRLNTTERGRVEFPIGTPVELTATLRSVAGGPPVGLQGTNIALVTPMGKEPGQKTIRLENPKPLALPAGISERLTDFVLGDRAFPIAPLEVGKYQIQLETRLRPQSRQQTATVPQAFRKHRFTSNPITIEIVDPEGGEGKSEEPESPQAPDPIDPELARLLGDVDKHFVNPLMNTGETIRDRLIRWKEIGERLTPDGRGDRPYVPDPETFQKYWDLIDQAVHNESIPAEEREFLKRFYKRD